MRRGPTSRYANPYGSAHPDWRPEAERLIRKLDTDQYRFLRLNYHGEIQDTLMVSESGVYALMIYHHIPENRNLRQW